MANNITEFQILRGDSASNAMYTGKEGVLTADMESTPILGRGIVRLHDGASPGGFIVGGIGGGGGGGVVAVTAGSGLAGGTITSTGTISLNTGSSHFIGGVQQVTSSLAISSSYAGTSSYAIYALNSNGAGFPYTGDALITGSLIVSSSGILLVGAGLTGSVFGTSSWASSSISASFARTASFAVSASYAPGSTLPNGVISSSAQVVAALPIGTVSSSTQINTGSFRGSFTGELLGTSSWANYSVTASYISGGIKISNGLLITGSLLVSGAVTAGTFTGPLIGTSSWAVSSSRTLTSSFAVSASYAPATGDTVSSSFAITSSYALVAQTLLGSIESASYAATASVVLGSIQSASFASTASFALNAGGSGFPFSGSALITGSLVISGSGLTVTGSANVEGAFTATTKSFLINHQRLLGKKLVYGVVEAPEHSVLVRGKLEGATTIVLPEEWEWLVDMDTITVQLTPIGTYQQLFVSSIDGLKIRIGTNGQWAEDVDCYYTVHATRKDVAPLETVV